MGDVILLLLLLLLLLLWLSCRYCSPNTPKAQAGETTEKKNPPLNPTMDNSTHSTASSQSQSQLPEGASTTMSLSSSSSLAITTTSNGNDYATTNIAGSGGTNVPTRKPQAPSSSREQAQLLKLREANTKYKNLLKLAKERIQEQESLLEERQGMM